jgi:hypothetical protein
VLLGKVNAPEYDKRKKERKKERKNKLTKPKFGRKIEENMKRKIEKCGNSLLNKNLCLCFILPP